MKFVDLISYYHIPYVSEKGIAIWKINSEIREEENIPGIDSHAILFVVGGSMEISVQGKIQSLTRGYFVDVLGDKQSVKLLSASPDIQAYFLLLTDEYLLELFKNRPPLPLSYAMDIMQNPVYMIENSFIVSIIKCLDDIIVGAVRNLPHILQILFHGIDETLQLVLRIPDIILAYQHFIPVVQQQAYCYRYNYRHQGQGCHNNRLYIRHLSFLYLHIYFPKCSVRYFEGDIPYLRLNT